jgi:hypothetical protein
MKLDEKIDRVLEKLDNFGQRVTAVETSAAIYARILAWGGSTIVGILGAIVVKVFL